MPLFRTRMTTRCGSLAQAEWGINAIRLPMNEDCWLGLNRANPKTSGPVYQKTFVAFVEQLLGSGFVVVLDLHWTSHTGALAEGASKPSFPRPILPSFPSTCWSLPLVFCVIEIWVLTSPGARNAHRMRV